MATTKQIQYRVGQAKKKLAKLNKEVTATANNIKKLIGAQLKKAKVAKKAPAKEKKAPAKKKKAPAKKKATARKKR